MFLYIMDVNIYSLQLQELFIEGNDDLVLQKGKKYYSNTENNKKKKRSVCPELAFKNLTTSQKSLFKRKSLPIVSKPLFLK